MLFDVRPTRKLNPLLDVKARHRFDDDFGDDAAGADAADCGFEKIVSWLQLMDLAFAVDQLETSDFLADKSPIAARAMHVSRDNAGDALRVVRGQVFKCQTVFQQPLRNVAHASAAFEPHVSPFFLDHASVAIE